MIVYCLVPESALLPAKVLACLIGQRTEAELLSFTLNRQRDGSLFAYAGDMWSQAQWDSLVTAQQEGITAVPPEFLIEWMTENGVSMDDVTSTLNSLVILDTLPDTEEGPSPAPTTMVIYQGTGIDTAYGLEGYEAPEPEVIEEATE